MKTKLSYTVRTTRAPGETRDSIVPVIVERLNPVELETVVENCIDRGLIAGLKTTAAHGIAEGVAAQIAREFSLGRGVQFGQYFYGRPYLSGTVDANGRLTGDNKINVRLYKGAEFKLALEDFSFTLLLIHLTSSKTAEIPSAVLKSSSIAVSNWVRKASA